MWKKIREKKMSMEKIQKISKKFDDIFYFLQKNKIRDPQILNFKLAEVQAELKKPLSLEMIKNLQEFLGWLIGVSDNIDNTDLIALNVLITDLQSECQDETVRVDNSRKRKKEETNSFADIVKGLITPQPISSVTVVTTATTKNFREEITDKQVFSNTDKKTLSDADHPAAANFQLFKQIAQNIYFVLQGEKLEKDAEQVRLFTNRLNAIKNLDNLNIEQHCTIVGEDFLQNDLSLKAVALLDKNGFIEMIDQIREELDQQLKNPGEEAAADNIRLLESNREEDDLAKAIAASMEDFYSSNNRFG
jgi:hypothetical protein